MLITNLKIIHINSLLHRFKIVEPIQKLTTIDAVIDSQFLQTDMTNIIPKSLTGTFNFGASFMSKECL